MDVSEVGDQGTLKAYLEGLPEGERASVKFRIMFNHAIRMLPILQCELCKLPRKSSTTIRALDAFICTAVFGIQANSETSDLWGFALQEYGSDFFDDINFQSENETTRHPANFNSAYRFASSALTFPLLGVGWGQTMPGAQTIDLERLRRDLNDEKSVIWESRVPLVVEAVWNEAKAALEAEPDEKWGFWIAWYERVIGGKDWYPQKILEALLKIKSLEKSSDSLGWRDDPAIINARFDEILKIYERDSASANDKNDASKAAYFDFVEIKRQMSAVGFPSDKSAFESEEIRAAFSRAVAEMLNVLEDWCDLARAQLQGRNTPVTVVVAVEKLMDQLGDIGRGEDVSLRNVIRVGGTARRHARKQSVADALEEELHDDLMEALDEYSNIVREHLGDTLAALEALRGLELGELDSAEVLQSLKSGVAALDQTPDDVLLPPDAKTRAIFNSMIADLEDEQSEIEEAVTDQAKQTRRKRFAEKFGGVSATFGTYVEKGRQGASKGGKYFDEASKWWKRWETVEKIIKWWESLSSGGGQ